MSLRECLTCGVAKQLYGTNVHCRRCLASGSRRCSVCDDVKTSDGFYRKGRGWYPYCKSCSAVKRRTYYLANREKLIAQTAAWVRANPERAAESAKRSAAQRKARDPKAFAAGSKERTRRYRARYPEIVAQAKRRWDLSKYGLSETDFANLLVAQDGRCAVCKTDKPGGPGGVFVVDHCHATGAVRGLLCSKCNGGMGLLNDDPELLLDAAAYLISPPALDVKINPSTIESIQI